MTAGLEPQADEMSVLNLRAQLQFERDQLLETQRVYNQQRVEYQERIADLESRLGAESESRAECEAKLAAYEQQRVNDEEQREDYRAYIAALEDVIASNHSLRANLIKIAEVSGLRKKPTKIHPNYGEYI